AGRARGHEEVPEAVAVDVEVLDARRVRVLDVQEDRAEPSHDGRLRHGGRRRGDDEIHIDRDFVEHGEGVLRAKCRELPLHPGLHALEAVARHGVYLFEEYALRLEAVEGDPHHFVGHDDFGAREVRPIQLDAVPVDLAAAVDLDPGRRVPDGTEGGTERVEGCGGALLTDAREDSRRGGSAARARNDTEYDQNGQPGGT